MDALSDPRRFPDPDAAPSFAAALHSLAAKSLGAPTGREAEASDATIRGQLEDLVARGDGEALAGVLASAPTVAVYRHLWRSVSRLAGTGRDAGGGLAVTLFAIPIVVVVASTDSEPGVQLPGVVPDVSALVDALREHGALAANRAFGLANALVSASAIDIARLPALLASCLLADGHVPLALAPAPIDVTAGERAHLRFLVGSAVAAPGADLLRDASVGAWGMPLARSLITQLSVRGATVVALPRAPMSLPAAIAQGRAAQRDVSAQLFTSNALRALRASAGEPAAVISAHIAADAPGGGELRVSLSSAFDPRDAQGLRCPLHPGERVADVATMLVDLLHDCRVTDIRVLPGVHADRDPVTGGPLLFKPATIPPSADSRH